MRLRTLLLTTVCALLLQACASTPINKAERAFARKNYNLAFQELLPLAQKGNAQAQYAVGYMYYNGNGVKKDFHMAEFWFHKAADQDDAKAVQALAMIKEAQASATFPPPRGIHYAMLNERNRQMA